MARTVREWPKGTWHAWVWDEAAATGATCPDAAMLCRRFDSEEEAQRWAHKHEQNVITRYRARCAYEAGAPCVKPEWAVYYRMWAEDDAAFAAMERDDEQAG